MKITKRTLFLIFVTFLLSQGLINGHPLTYNEVTLFQTQNQQMEKTIPFQFWKDFFKKRVSCIPCFEYFVTVQISGV